MFPRRGRVTQGNYLVCILWHVAELGLFFLSYVTQHHAVNAPPGVQPVFLVSFCVCLPLSSSHCFEVLNLVLKLFWGTVAISYQRHTSVVSGGRLVVRHRSAKPLLNKRGALIFALTLSCLHVLHWRDSTLRIEVSPIYCSCSCQQRTFSNPHSWSLVSQREAIPPKSGSLLWPRTPT